MKKTFLYIILFCYAMVMLKPLLPFASDFIGHVFFKTQHMATVHYENGKYHVHKEVAKNAKEESSDKNTSNNKKSTSITEHFISFSSPGFYSVSINERVFKTMITPDILMGNHQCNFPPPRV